jgi:hypothetical protein
MRPCKQVRERGRGVRETFRINNRRCGRPNNADCSRHSVRFHKFHAQVVVVDLTGCQRGDGMIGQGGLLFRLGPGSGGEAPTGADLCG